ncbi:MAG: tetratricopeptide repeat protein [Candidatus Riflebacteria bacterium]
MSDSESSGGFGMIRGLIFLVVLIVSAPFLIIGNYKNGLIQEGIDGSLAKMKKYDFIESQKKMEEAGEHFGFLYDCYVMVLPVIGGKYYDKKTYYGLRGVVRASGIAHRMAKGELDLDELIDETEKDLDKRGVFPKDLKSLQKMGQDQIKALKKLLPIMRDSKKQNYDKALADLRIFMGNEKNLEYEVVIMPLTTLLHELAINTRDGPMIEMAKAIVFDMSKKTKNPFFQSMRIKVESLSVQPIAEAPRKTSLKDKFASGMALMKKKQFEKARPLIEQCYKERPDNDKVCYALALIRRKMGQNDEARKLCNEILLRSPDSAAAKKLLASIK